MITIPEALLRVFGDVGDPPRRALVIGAGFAKACAPWSPLFNNYKGPVKDELVRNGDPSAEALDLEKTEITDLIERLDRLAGRTAIARVLFQEPISSFQLAPGEDAGFRPLPLEQPRTYPLLREWRTIAERRLTHLAPLYPDAPNLIVGWLLAEGLVEEILSTNWDALIELGAMLAGICVEDAEEPDPTEERWWCDLPTSLRVFETQDQLVGRWQREGQPTLFKVHGGIRTIQRALGQGKPEEREEALKRSFLVTSHDLIRWEGASRWTEERVSATLRSSACLLLGVSGSDPVMYRAVREQFADWEQAAAREFAAPRRPGTPRPWHPLRIVSVTFSETLRQRNMLTAQLPGGRYEELLSVGSTQIALFGIYAICLLRDIEKNVPVPHLHAACLREVEENRVGPILKLLCFSLGNGVRWAAEALEEGPFRVQHPGAAPFRRWWYAPWRKAPQRGRVLREVAPLLESLAIAPQHFEVDEWTGIIHVLPDHPRAVELAQRNGVAKAPFDLLLLPSPWGPPSQEGLSPVLRHRLTWGEGRALPALGRARLYLLPVGWEPWEWCPSVAHISETSWYSPDRGNR